MHKDSAFRAFTSEPSGERKTGRGSCCFRSLSAVWCHRWRFYTNTSSWSVYSSAQTRDTNTFRIILQLFDGISPDMHFWTDSNQQSTVYFPRLLLGMKGYKWKRAACRPDICMDHFSNAGAGRRMAASLLSCSHASSGSSRDVFSGFADVRSDTGGFSLRLLKLVTCLFV